MTWTVGCLICPLRKKPRFNRLIADILLPEYGVQTGVALRLVACDREFPDLVCEPTAGGKPIGIELAEWDYSLLTRKTMGCAATRGDSVSRSPNIDLHSKMR
jgi:hypothetical protein